MQLPALMALRKSFWGAILWRLHRYRAASMERYCETEPIIRDWLVYPLFLVIVSCRDICSRSKLVDSLSLCTSEYGHLAKQFGCSSSCLCYTGVEKGSHLP